MESKEETLSLINVIKKMKSVNVFKNYIEYIRFPFYRNLEPDTKITFDYPLTFFVGKNGGGKSSTLQALYGCPRGKSLGDYWFSTDLDPIKEAKERNCFIYSYIDEKILKEVLKQRGKRDKGKVKKADPDYWETARPNLKYGMNTSLRNTPINKHVEYIDFRSELSAYDSYMYFTAFNATRSMNSKQDFVRRYSKKIKLAFDSEKIINLYGKKCNHPVKKLNNDEVEAISYILGKKYKSVEILDHRFLKTWGFSVRFSTSSLSYSEAFAGSGETAVIVLVHKVINCPEETLLLLDEPEVSLHSGAQKRLRNFLLKQIKNKKLQIVISTHSPFFLEGMPANSIKIFSLNNLGFFHVENEREPKEAFYELEIDNSNQKIQLIIEDELAKNIIERVVNNMGVDILNSFDLKYMPGGASALKQRLTAFLDLGAKPKIFFDGDQKKQESVDLNTLAGNEIDTSAKLAKIIFEQTGAKIDFFVDGGSNGGDEKQKVILMQNYLKYYFENVFYLPKMIPEEIIWCDDYAKSKIKVFVEGEEEQVLQEIKHEGNAKDWFYNLCLKLYAKNDNLKMLQEEFILQWCKKKDNSLLEIQKLINNIRKEG